MSHLLWQYYYNDDVDQFRRLLAPALYGAQNSPGPGQGVLSTSPGISKLHKASGPGTGLAAGRHGFASFTKAELNTRDHAGLTILLRAASSTSKNALVFVQALLEHPAIDIYAQDIESGWNALHRALYTGNIAITQLLLDKERRDLTYYTASVNKIGLLIKTKDHEGNSPFDLFNSTIEERDNKASLKPAISEDGTASDDASAMQDTISLANEPQSHTCAGLGEDMFAFGSNKNLSLGFGDEDDRHFPERLYLQRPDHLLQRFHEQFLDSSNLEGRASSDPAKIPVLILNRPMVIRDVVLSKLHSAILTTDPVSNLYVCGIGRGGRLGLGDENARFTYTPVQGPLAERQIIQVALGQNHTLAVDDTGALWTWGNNSDSQLGYVLPQPPKQDEFPSSTWPRQVFGPLKKEVIVGVAASAIHSAAHTGTSLYCWGKNLGQLALMDADSRSLEVQPIPRKVAASMFSSPIVAVTAIDRATTILLQNHTVCVFTAYGYHIVRFPFGGLDPIGNIPWVTLPEPGRNQIHHVTSGGDTIAALTGRGDLFTFDIDHRLETNPSATSTTNPSKIKGAVTQPRCIWTARKDGVRSVGVAEHGSVIISTESGAVWRRVARAKAKGRLAGPRASKAKDFKFQRVPYITNVAAVRASPFGSFAAIRRDSNIMKERPSVAEGTLWHDVGSLCCLEDFHASEPAEDNHDRPTFWEARALKDSLGSVAYEVLSSPDLETDIRQHLTAWKYRNGESDVALCTTSSPDIKVPVQGWLLAARSPVFRSALSQLRKSESYYHTETFGICRAGDQTIITFQSLDLISLLNLILYLYEDKVIPAWNFTRHAPLLAYRYRQIRSEVMRLASRLNLTQLETAARLQVPPQKCMDKDFQSAVRDHRFFEDSDALLELDGREVPVHSMFLCQRCPWFDGLFHGRSGGLWLASRRAGRESGSTAMEKLRLDMTHMDLDAFQYVLQHLYGDVGVGIFDHAVCDTFDDFVDLVMEVLSIADYLMLDRLSQICQQVMGRFANVRNISSLLNTIAPCSITQFKDAGLEYICLQMESMLENHLLDELDENLLLDLSEAVQRNQAAKSPFARSGRAELLLHQRHPELALEIEEERRIRVKEMAFKALKTHRDDDRRLVLSSKAKVDSSNDGTPCPGNQDTAVCVSAVANSASFGPCKKARDSQADLMFEMEDKSHTAATSTKAQKSWTSLPTPGRHQRSDTSVSWRDTRQDASRIPLAATVTIGPEEKSSSGTLSSPPLTKVATPWASSAFALSKMDLKDIIKSETSNIPAPSASLAVPQNKGSRPQAAQVKMSQRERKRLQQACMSQAFMSEAGQQGHMKRRERPSDEAPSSPWQRVGLSTRAKPVTPDRKPDGEPSRAAGPITKPLLAAEMHPISRRTAPPDTRFPGQSHTPKIPTVPATASSRCTSKQYSLSAQEGQCTPTPQPLIPHSTSYMAPRAKNESTLGLSITEIIEHERRKRQLTKEAAAKRPLQDIQLEQEFQEWWEAESKRIQEEEAKWLEREKEKEEESERGGRTGRGGRSKGGPGAKIGSAPSGNGVAGHREGGSGRSTSGKGRSPRRGGATVPGEGS